MLLLLLHSGCHGPAPSPDRGQVLYDVSCAACHQPDGRGMEGVAPPLAGSAWMDAPDEVLIRIVLHGLRGPVEADGRAFNLEMPALGFFSDAEIAMVLSYARKRWSASRKSVRPDRVREVRRNDRDRADSWTVEELEGN